MGGHGRPGRQRILRLQRRTDGQMTTGDERATRTDFAQHYALPTGDANARIERDVIGAVWGANGYTTVAQAEELGRRLQLRPDSRLLDLGTGRGWPGLYLAKRSGCSLIATDMPVEGLIVATRRARHERIDGRVA